MKVLHTVKYFYPSKGGMESAVQDIIKSVSLHTKEIDFTVFSNCHKPTMKTEKFLYNNINLIKEATPLIFKSQPLNFLYPTLKSQVIDTDIIHHHYPFPNMEYWIVRNKKLLRNKKLIITWHANINNSRWSLIEKIYNPLIEKILDIAEYIVVTSPQLYENSKVLHKYIQKVKVVPLSFNSELIVNSTTKRYPGLGKFNLLYVGKLRKYKGVEFLIEAIKTLDVKLTIIGDGEREKAIRKLISNYGLESKVELFKNIPLEDLKIFYKNSSLFVLPSINETEAFGIVQLEALANGLPVINTSLNSGVPFVSLNGVTGLTVPPKNSEALMIAISAIIENENLYEKFSTNALLRVNVFSNDKLGEMYKSLYLD